MNVRNVGNNDIWVNLSHIDFFFIKLFYCKRELKRVNGIMLVVKLLDGFASPHNITDLVFVTRGNMHRLNAEEWMVMCWLNIYFYNTVCI